MRCGEPVLILLFDPHPEEPALASVSKDAGPTGASWFETREDAFLTMRVKQPSNNSPLLSAVSFRGHGAATNSKLA